MVSFYDRAYINGEQTKRPHIAVTFYGHDYDNDGGRKGLVDIITDAVENNAVLHLDKKARADLPLIAKRAPLGNVTSRTLQKSIAQFQREVNQFKGANKIDYSRETTTPTLSEEQQATPESASPTLRSWRRWARARCPRPTRP